MKYQVYLIQDAEIDIFSICSYIGHQDSKSRALYVYEKLQEYCFSLEHSPFRGHIPPELDALGVRGFLEIHFKPYRIMYQVRETKVFVHCVIDGRRELQELLQNRLLR
jgi:toxin ParE1/3/4